MDRDHLGGFELLILAVGGVAALVIAITWGGAALALLVTDGPIERLPPGAAAHALRRLPGHLTEPATAWPPHIRTALPGPITYWACTAAAATAAAAVGAIVVRCARPGWRVGTAPRHPLGVDGRAQFASRRDLTPVLTRTPEPGRFVVGHRGRWLVATEATPQQHDTKPVHAHRQGDRGAVALVGPARSGKTTAAIAGILDWDGPAILSSVKADLLAATIGWRSEQGAARVFDPTHTVPTTSGRASWSPLRQAGTVAGAQRAARALCEAAPRGGTVEGGIDFWLAQGEILLSGLLYVAHHTGRHMGTVADWVLLQDRPGDLGPGEVRTLLDILLARDDDIATGAVEASRGLLAIWNMDDRTCSSVYATVQTVVWPWSEATVAASSRGPSVDLDWLLADPNTLYLCAPIEDQRRLAPAFGGLLNDLIGHAYRHVAVTGQPLDPPLLVVVDEAGNTPLRSLPEYASTLAGIGVLLVTIWQSLAQIEVTYGRAADTILTNHLTKVFYAGLSDPASLRYIAQLLGDTELETRSRSFAGQLGRGSTQLAAATAPLAPPHALRQMRPGDALLIHGTLPPAHIRTRPYYRDRRLAGRAAERPVASADQGGRRSPNAHDGDAR
jgi:type IV secretion system protein VirD4